MSLAPYMLAGRKDAGCDEAGRGCLAGPVVAAAVILPEAFDMPTLNDSKLLREADRVDLEAEIKRQAIAWSIGVCDVAEIDKYNILQASIRAMHKALDSLKEQPEFLLIDGNYFLPYRDLEHECIVKGDGKFAAIAAASILAKTHRDRLMQGLHHLFPYYGWHSNKGYPTIEHREAIRTHGINEHHRRSFRLLPVEEDQQVLFDL